MESLSTIHTLLSNTVWLFFLAVGSWGVYRGIRGADADGNYLGSVAIGQILIYVQAILGVVLWFGGADRPLDGFMHWLYGAFSLVFLPFVYLVWLRGDDSNQAQWVLGFAMLFMFGIVLRSISTGV